MKLTASDLFTLFNQAASAMGGSGYGYPWAKAGTATQQLWNEFHKMVSSYVDGAPTQAKVKATINPVTATEDAISEDVRKYDWDSQKTMYKFLYTLGHRINR